MLTKVILFLIGILLTQQPVVAEERDVQRVAMDGWMAARDLAPKGGALEFLGPVNARLRELDRMSNTSARYAEVAIRAAVSAAQEERDEMQLFLEHARDLSRQLELAGSPAAYPLPIDELEGELWLEVDRYEEARAAYTRAVEGKPTANALVGLARANAKLGDVIGACAAYTRARGTPGLPSAVELEISLYALKCGY
jgi:tetratricopeptide (TPR) repeat protein